MTSSRGFTLLEVMVAIAILAMGMVAVSDVAGGALRNHVRAKQLDVATVLARGKVAALEDKYDEEGFRVDDEEDEGSFEDQGHPEVRWKAEVKKPSADLTGTALCDRLLGEGGIDALVGEQTKPKDGGPQTVSPADAAIGTMVKAQCAAMGETVKKAVRELRLTVSWPDGKATRSFTTVEHLVVLTPAQGKP
jgi:general secretion pathway protein I